MEKTSFYSYVYKKYNEKNEEHKRELDPKEYQKFFFKNLKCFPYFPDVDLILELSYENYERKACNVDLIFLPFDSLYIKGKSDPLIFSYANKKMTFEKEQIRLIRKVVETSDRNHALVLCRNKENTYFFKGIINESEIDDALSDYYFIRIRGYSHWSAHCKNYDLFDFKNGIFCNFCKNDSDFDIQTKYITDYFYNCSFGTDICLLKKLLKIINDQEQGTSFVVFKDTNQAIEEARRLCDAQRGFKADKPLKYEELIKCIPLFTKVDGGFLLDSQLTCYAYGCIYDGYVKDFFKGSLANGSRFNSTALYTYNLNNPISTNQQTKHPDKGVKSINCLGVVFSDDGGVKIAK